MVFGNLRAGFCYKCREIENSVIPLKAVSIGNKVIHSNKESSYRDKKKKSQRLRHPVTFNYSMFPQRYGIPQRRKLNKTT